MKWRVLKNVFETKQQHDEIVRMKWQVVEIAT
jgi:hypothetical protein